MQGADHADAAGAFAVEDFGDAVLSREILFEILLPQAILLHAELDRRHGVREINRKLFLFVALDEQ